MRGTAIFTIKFLAAAPVFLVSAAPDYFPLQTGNQWIYRQDRPAQTLVVDIPGTGQFGGRLYHQVRGLADGAAWLRMSEDGTLYAWDAAQRREKIWAAFATPEGQTYATEITECNRTARIDSRSARYQGPVGEFEHALGISYPPSRCADAGITAEVYLPYVGLIERTVTTIAGPRKIELIYARLGGVTVISEPEISFTLTLDRAAYAAKLAPAVMTARLTLRSTHSEPVTLQFSTGQRYDLALKNEAGEVAYRWSDGKVFPLVLGSETIGPGEKNYAVEVRLAESGDIPLAPGRYTAEAWLATTGPRRYSAVVGFDILATR